MFDVDCGLRVVLLHTRELRKCVEVGVAVVEHERMLKHEGRNPHVVGGNRCTLLTQLSVHVCIMMRCLLVGIKDIDPGLSKKAVQNRLVARSLVFSEICGCTHPCTFEPVFRRRVSIVGEEMA